VDALSEQEVVSSRIAYLINQYPKVSHSFIRREIHALEAQGFAVRRIALRGWDAELVDAADQHERDRTRYVLRSGLRRLLGSVLSTLLANPGTFAKALAAALRLARRSDRSLAYHLAYLAEACQVLLWLREFGVTHLHAHFGTNSAEVALLVRSLGGPCYSFTVHGPEEFDRPEALALFDKIRAADFVVAVSSYGRAQLMRWADQRDWGKIEVVRCGVEPAFRDAPAVPIPCAPRLICVGRLCEQKGQLLLLEAVARLADRGVTCELVLAGDGEMRRYIEAAIARHKLESNVRMTGWVDSRRVREEIEAARALVLPSFAEGLPVVIMEAMALRRPVISTYVAGIPELVRDGENGWLVPAGDVHGLMRAVQALLACSPQQLAEMGEAGRARVLELHDVEREAAKLGEAFAASDVRAMRHSRTRSAAC
jgi:glycosyltransferase involved in cell wall biosynthesis